MNGWSPCHSHLCWLAEQQLVIPSGMGGTSVPQGHLGGCHHGLLSGDRVLVNSVPRLTSLVLLPDSLMRMPPRILPLPKTCANSALPTGQQVSTSSPASPTLLLLIPQRGGLGCGLRAGGPGRRGQVVVVQKQGAFQGGFR